MATAFTFTVIDEALYNKRFEPTRSKPRAAQTWRWALHWIVKSDLNGSEGADRRKVI